jgi:hypothetical protein
MKSKLKGVLGVALTLVILVSLTVGLATAPAGADPGKLKFTKLKLPQVDEWALGDAFSLECTADEPAQATVVETTPGTDVVDVTVLNEATGTDIDIAYAAGTWTIDLYDVGDSVLVTAIADGSEVTVTETDDTVTYAEVKDPANDMSGGIDTTGVTFDMPDGPNSYAAFGESEGDYWAVPGSDVGSIATSPGGDLFAIVYASGGTTDAMLMKSTTDGYSWKFMQDFRDTADAQTPTADTMPVISIATSPDYEEDETVFVATMWYVYQSVDGGETFTAMPADWLTDSEYIMDMDVTLDEKGRITIVVGTAYGTSDSYGDVYVYGSKTLTWVDQNVDKSPAANSTGDTFNVLAVAFSPFFADDELFMAAVTNDTPDNDDPITPESPVPGTTAVRFALTPTTDPTVAAPWAVTYGDARIRDADDFGFQSYWARIALPDDFSAASFDSNAVFAGFYAGLSGSGYDGNERGDVYKISVSEGPASPAVDLDIRGEVSTLLPTPTNITTLDVAGNAEDCHLIAGTDYLDFSSSPYYWLTYRSEDAGDSWAASMKGPTGGTFDGVGYASPRTKVLFAHDYLDSGIVYAGTAGDEGVPGAFGPTSAFSRSSDSGNTFNQISLMDYGDPNSGYAVVWADATGYNAGDTVHMVTQYDNDGVPTTPPTYGAVFVTNNAGDRWERIWSYANPFMDANVSQVWRIGDEAIFTVDFAAESIWRSSDMGATWLKHIAITKAGNLTTVGFVSETEFWTGFDNGDIWWSTSSGATWDKPEESSVTASVGAIFPMGPNVIISADDGVHFTSDGGDTIERVGPPGKPTTNAPASMPDVGFGDNHIIYATIPMVTGDGVWRTEVNFDDPGESEWVRIDDFDGAYTYTTVAAGGPPLCFPPSGVLYVVDATAVVKPDVTGGLWRSTNPTADVDGPNPPIFEKENKGLANNDMIGWMAFDLFPTTLFCGNFAAANYWEQVVMFTDTLDTGTPLVMPGDGEAGVGLLPEGDVRPDVSFAWEEMAGATKYQLQIGLDPNFKSTIPLTNDGFVSSLGLEVRGLNPNMTYYWRVRAANVDAGDLIGAPLISPWSETYKFKTAIGAAMARPRLEAPEYGEFDIPLSPTFEWSGIEWAEVYEFELALDPTTTAGGYFAEPLVALVGTSALPSTAWRCDITLDYETRYYWHVKAIGVDTDTPWSDVGTFTTMGVPPEPTTPGPAITIPPEEVITPAWIWAVVIIGAILVIAVIVLIVTTRRVP